MCPFVFLWATLAQHRIFTKTEYSTKNVVEVARSLQISNGSSIFSGTFHKLPGHNRYIVSIRFPLLSVKLLHECWVKNRSFAPFALQPAKIWKLWKIKCIGVSEAFVGIIHRRLWIMERRASVPEFESQHGQLFLRVENAFSVSTSIARVLRNHCNNTRKYELL